MNWPTVVFLLGFAAIMAVIAITCSYFKSKRCSCGKADTQKPKPPRVVQTSSGTIYKDPPPTHYMNWEARFPKQVTRPYAHKEEGNDET